MFAYNPGDLVKWDNKVGTVFSTYYNTIDHKYTYDIRVNTEPPDSNTYCGIAEEDLEPVLTAISKRSENNHVAAVDIEKQKQLVQPKFKVGDHVVIRHSSTYSGQHGVIVKFTNLNDIDYCVVKLDNGSQLNFREHELVLAENEKQKSPDNFPQDHEDNEYRYFSPAWLDAIAYGLTKGAVKHPNETWRQIPAKEHVWRAIRHLTLYLMGNKEDQHLVNASMRVMMAFENDKEGV